MKIATWNVNSLRARLARVESWIVEHAPDVLLLQETKCADDAFPSEAFSLLGYDSAHHGNGRWNGVAIASRVGLADARSGFLDEIPNEIEESRILAATCGDIRFISVYVPNGRAVDSEHYEAKLAWLAKLSTELEAEQRSSESIVIGGDFNVAPEDRDVWDIDQFVGMTHVTEPERRALARLSEQGMIDAVRRLHPDGTGPFSWWDYRAGSFHKGWGMRIDHLFVSPPVAARLRSALVDREARKGPQPSDHAPVVIEIE